MHIDLTEQARRQYYHLKSLYEKNEEHCRSNGMPIPPRSKAFHDLQEIFEPFLSLGTDLLAENNDVPMNKGWRRK